MKRIPEEMHGTRNKQIFQQTNAWSLHDEEELESGDWILRFFRDWS
jgi:hypothetical protein